jgi:hypothetical protein
VLRLVDIICCGAILVPIIWSIKHLRDAAAIDGKGNHLASTQLYSFARHGPAREPLLTHYGHSAAAKRNMEKLKLFREFYLLVVTYIYFTRIIVFLLDATLHYQYVWLGEFFTELATLIFWGLTGYTQPASSLFACFFCVTCYESLPFEPVQLQVQARRGQPLPQAGR